MTDDSLCRRRARCSRAILAGCFLIPPFLLAAQTAPSAAPSAAPATQTASPATSPASGASATPLTFDVVSVKPDKSGSNMFRIMMTPDGISISGAPLHMLLRESFHVSDNQLIGEPGWVSNDRFDIEAKVAAEDAPRLKDVKPMDRLTMLLPVFQERFALKYHRETRDLMQYELVIAKGGVTMKEAADADDAKSPDGTPRGPMMRVSPGEFSGQGVSISDILRFLSFQFHSPVLDKTGLKGKYDVDLKWTPEGTDGSMMRPQDVGQPGAGNPALPANTGPSIFTALEEQLGLKVEAHKEPGDAIVIDHIEQPSPN